MNLSAHGLHSFVITHICMWCFRSMTSVNADFLVTTGVSNQYMADFVCVFYVTESITLCIPVFLASSICRF